MKKSIILAAGFMAMALAGSAQAATMFAVQNSSAVDQATIADNGDIATLGMMNIGGKYGGGLVNAPYTGVGTPLAVPYGPFHVATRGNALSTAAFIAQNVTTGTGVVTGGYPAAVAPSFSFYRVNYDTTALTYRLPMLDHTLGLFAFGTINAGVDPNGGTSRKNAAAFAVRTESDWSATGTVIDVTPTYFIWSSNAVGGNLVERMRLTSVGTLKIANGSADTTTSKLNITGLPQSVDELTVPAGLVRGDLWRTASNIIKIVP